MPEVKVQTFRVTAAVDREIRRHGEETYPHECCGACRHNGHTTATVRCRTRPRKAAAAVHGQAVGLPAGGAASGGIGGTCWVLPFAPVDPARPSQTISITPWPTFAHHRRRERRSCEAGSPRRSAEGAKAGDMTVWFLKEDRSEFEEGELNGD
jgi:hypothetical protein